MFLLKACAKCGGDLIIEGANLDRWGEPADIVCIQCGHTTPPAERDDLLRRLSLAKRRRQPELIPVKVKEVAQGRYS